MKCGQKGCNATANPTDTLPVTCSNTTTPRVHHRHGMMPTFVCVIQANCCTHDFSPKSPDGSPIPVFMSILMPVRCHAHTRFDYGTFRLQVVTFSALRSVFLCPRSIFLLGSALTYDSRAFSVFHRVHHALCSCCSSYTHRMNRAHPIPTVFLHACTSPFFFLLSLSELLRVLTISHTRFCLHSPPMLPLSVFSLICHFS